MNRSGSTLCICKTILVLIFILTSFNSFSQGNIPSLEKFILKNFQIPDLLKTDCNWNYLAVELTLDSNNNLNTKIINDASPHFINSLDFFKNYRISEKDKEVLPALVIINIKNESGNCGDKPFHTPYAADIAGTIISLINDELNIFPKIKIIGFTFTVSYNSHQNGY
jgi:hypothetical protein